jgi:hypothetical protein
MIPALFQKLALLKKYNYLTVHATSGYWCTFANYLWKPIVLCIAMGMQKSAESEFGKHRGYSPECKWQMSPALFQTLAL